MKPARSPQTTGFLPSRPTSALTSSSTSGSVTTVRMISTKLCTGAGLKKWTPMTRPGWALAVEISVTLRLEVLVARIASGFTIGLEVAEDRLLDLDRLDHRLDDEVGVGQVLHGRGEGDPAHQRLLVVLAQLAARHGTTGGVQEVLHGRARGSPR